MKPHPHRPPRRVNRSWIVVVPPLVLGVAVLLLMMWSDRVVPPSPPASAPVAADVAAAPETTRPAFPELAFAPASSAWPAVIETDASAQALGESITAAYAALAQKTSSSSPSPMPPIPVPDADSVRRRLAHRNFPLSDTQWAALSRLRWKSPGKYVEWRSAAQKPVVIYLEGRRLEAAAAAAEPGRTLAETTARRFLRRNADLLGAGDGETAWHLDHETTDTLGYTQVRFDQRWRGLEVWPGAIMVQTAPGGDVTLVTAAYAPEPALDPAPALSADEARRAATAGLGLLAPSAIGEPELLVHAPLEEEARLAWRVRVDQGLTARHEVFVDARDGAVIARLPLVVTAAATGSGVDLNGVTRQINLWHHTDNRYYMIDTSKQMFDPTSQPPDVANSRGVIAVLDQQGGTQPNIAGSVHNVANAATGPWDTDAVSASANLNKVYDYYLQRFNRNSVNGQGGSMTGIVNLEDENAYADFQTQTMIFGNRDKYAEALDVVAHEMTHSVISTTSKLVYSFQPGALNESFADVLGEGCEAHFNNGTPDWLMGTSLREQLRSMSDPNTKMAFGTTPLPKKMSQFITLTADQDNGGVHFNSSITNHAFYQLAAGLPGAIGLDETLQVFYRAVTTKLNANSQFIDARFGCIQSAKELFGDGSTQAQRTAEAFDVVEIFDQAPSPNPTPTTPVNAQDSTLFTFPSGFFTYVGRREARFNDDAAGVFLGDNGQPTPAMPQKKPAVRGDGTIGIFVMPNADAALIDTETGQEAALGQPGQIESAALSADGRVHAFVLSGGGGQPSNRVAVFDQVTNQTQTYTITQPLTDQSGGATQATVLYVDALDISADGRFIYYDALNRLIFPGGGFIETWSISFIDRQAGSIQNLIPPLPNYSVGNPSFGQTRAELLTFDVRDEATGFHYIYASNLATGAMEPVAALQFTGGGVAPGWPGYTGDDTGVVYTNYFFDFFYGWVTYLEVQPLQADGVTLRGQSSIWLSGSSPTLGSVYRRGEWQRPPEITVTAADATASEAGPDHGAFLISRSGPTTTALAFSFVLTGTATNGADYQTLPLTATIAAGQSGATLPITIIDDTLVEGEETVVLSLSEGMGYTLGAARSATVTIADNDTAGGLTFATWAAEHQLGATDYAGDPDGDGFSNLVEYALGTPPRGPNPPGTLRFFVEGGQGVLELTRTHKPDDVSLEVEVTDDLRTGAWVSGAAHTTTVMDSATTLRVRDNAPAGTKPARFLRLKVTKL